jgi:hypothetical protein
MVLDWLSKSTKNRIVTVADLIARKEFPKAIEMLQEQLRQRPKQGQLRIQLADTLILAGRNSEAVSILREIADELARDGFAAKSIAILKRIQRIEPGKKGVEEKLATLIEEKSRLSTTSTRLKAVTVPVQQFDMEEAGPELELGMEPVAPLAAEAPAEPEPGPVPVEPEPAPVPVEPEPAPAPAAAAPPPVEGPDLFDTEFDFASEEPEPVLATPLFPDFSRDELVAVIQGLELITFDPGDIVVSEGEPGDSLFLLTTGTVKAFVRNSMGHYTKVREMVEGDFFGEVSILTGRPRTATVTAAGHCELLELDRATLEDICAVYPNVREVLQRFYDQRFGSASEQQARGAGDSPLAHLV